MKKKIQYIIGIIVVAALIALDQISKILAHNAFASGDDKVIIKKILEFTYLENKGAAWGMFAGKQFFFIALTVLLIFSVIFLLIKLPEGKRYTPARIISWVLLAGAVGNMIDRIAFGYVRDFINCVFIDFPVFNVADIYVSLSMVALVIFILFFYKDKDFDFLKRKKKKEPDNNNE